jgi:hypothetical protein
MNEIPIIVDEIWFTVVDLWFTMDETRKNGFIGVESMLS